MLIAQISDTHIRPKGVLAMGRVDTAGHLAWAVTHINALRPAPDLVLNVLPFSEQPVALVHPPDAPPPRA